MEQVPLILARSLILARLLLPSILNLCLTLTLSMSMVIIGKWSFFVSPHFQELVVASHEAERAAA